MYNVLLKRIGKMKVGLLKNFVHYFNLEEGTVLIAVFQLVNMIYHLIITTV